MCRVPDKDDPKYKDDEEAYEDDLEEMQEKTDALKPKDFPYTFYLMDAAQEKAFDDPIFATYRGPVYWNDCGRDFIVDPNQPKENFQPENMANLVYSSLTPLKVFSGGEKPLTPRTLCEGVAKVKFIPGEHCFLENIQIQLREIKGEECMPSSMPDLSSKMAYSDLMSEGKIRLKTVNRSTGCYTSCHLAVRGAIFFLSLARRE